MVPIEELCGLSELDLVREMNCTFPLSVFPHLWNVSEDNSTLHLIWPCEVRTYWISLGPFVNTVRFLLSYVTAFIIILGLTMNTLSFLILNSPPLCRTSLSVFLRALAVSDNGALIFNFATGLGRSHIPEFAQIFEDNVWMCGASKVLVNVFLFYSTWLVVGLTMKRLLVIGCPLTHGFRCTVSCAKKIVYCIGVSSFLLACLKLKYTGYEQDSTFGYKSCSSRAENSDKVVYIYVALSTWLPCLFIFIGNVLLIRQVRIINKSRFQLTGDRAGVSKWNDTHRMLGMLLTVSLTCLLLMLPLGVVETFELYWDVVLLKKPSGSGSARNFYIRWQQEKILLKWIRGLFFWLYQWNFATNFFLYCLTGRKFRTAAAMYFKRHLPFGQWWSQVLNKSSTVKNKTDCTNIELKSPSNK